MAVKFANHRQNITPAETSSDSPVGVNGWRSRTESSPLKSFSDSSLNPIFICSGRIIDWPRRLPQPRRVLGGTSRFTLTNGPAKYDQLQRARIKSKIFLGFSGFSILTG